MRSFILPTEPSEGNEILEIYNIGSTICVDIHTGSFNRNWPLLITLECGDVGHVRAENISHVVPYPVVTWKHTSLDGLSAYFAINTDPRVMKLPFYMPPDKFTSAFPGLSGPNSRFTVSTRVSSGFEFSLMNVNKDLSNQDYLNLRSAFGLWECTLSNALGSQTETTFISDSCKSTLVVIPQNSGIIISIKAKYLQYIKKHTLKFQTL